MAGIENRASGIRRMGAVCCVDDTRTRENLSAKFDGEFRRPLASTGTGTATALISGIFLRMLLH
jgi:hypothetical protein